MSIFFLQKTSQEVKVWILNQSGLLKSLTTPMLQAVQNTTGKQIFIESTTGPIRSSSCDVHLCVRVFNGSFHVVYFEAYFSPTSWSRMSKIFRGLKSLGKSAVKKWSQNWTFLLGCGLTSPHKKKLFFADFAFQNMVETTLPDGLETSGQRVYRKFGHISKCFWVFPFWITFSVYIYFLVFVYFWSTLLWHRC